MSNQHKTLRPKLLARIEKYWRAAMALSVGDIYCHDNPLLLRPLALAVIQHGRLGNGTPSDLGRVHLTMDGTDRLPQTGDPALALKRRLEDKRIEHPHGLNKHSQDMPEMRNWKWPG